MARIKEDDIETLRERADMVEVVSAYSQLKRSGGHTFKGLCPFHSEKTPSFQVDVARGLYHCFGCGEGGNIYHFVQKMESLPFPEAVEWLARKSGFELRYEEMRPGEARSFGVKVRLLEVCNEAAAFFHHRLMSDDAAIDARRYLSSRGFGKEVAGRWSIGWAPGRDSLCKHLLAKKFKQEEIIQADLGRVSDRDSSLYDSFRQRITFPTWNLQGDVVGFGARAMGDQQPKYLNTSETPVFSKSRIMYGLNRAKSAIARGSAVVVEGYTDVIALHESGITEAVATNGVALGETHFELLKKFSSRAILMFDSDEAGKGATERGFGIHHKIGLEVLVAPLPAGRDPADVVKEDGPEGIKKVIDGAQSLLEFKLEQTIARLQLDTPEARSTAVREAVQVLRLHPDPIARHEYAFMAANRIGVDQEVVQRALSEQRTTPSGFEETRDRDRRLPGHVKVEREALQLLLVRTREAKPLLEDISAAEFTSGPRRELFAASIERDPEARISDITGDLTPEALSLMTELTVGFVDILPEDLDFRVREVFGRLRLFNLERAIKARRNTLQDVNPLEHPQRHDELFTELVGLEAERRDLLRSMETLD
ncbi:MAG: DNA primase [Actinobacteria bacterium]|nr:DNA primase [Actinomycetota bacterium]